MGARYLVSPSIRKAPSAYAIALGLPLRMLIPPTRFSKSVACTWRYHGQNSDDASVTVARNIHRQIYPQRVLFARIVIIPPSFSINRL
ncbi:hypothetical protein OPQ81_011369 [Rhizoctonia solani]|nr:hypothetical protein OPQ81_011369 [Rhizoctonia solani]